MPSSSARPATAPRAATSTRPVTSTRPITSTRNVSLTPELDGFIAERLASGDFNNASEVVRTALKLLRDGASEIDSAAAPVTWPIGGGECGGLIRGHDWDRTSLGPIPAWSASLRATVTTLVNPPVP
ncbi:MAG: type II toxin-antitoxin system ParD family antitoxin, partial [Gluconacetobacter diazotrophicus]|nr:type II toxin-antitoxin system ParD family antitoxin [Gluconacetobacter diazotrophicus]